jgi:two-component sensor histidine kinase
VPDSIGPAYYIRRIITADVNTCFLTTSAGLFKYNLLTHQVTAASVSKSKNIEDQFKYNLQNGFYDNGRLWIASRNGLFTYDISTGTTDIYSGKGLQTDYYLFDVSNAANNQVVCAAGDGITLFNKKTKTFKIVNSLANLYKPDCENVIGSKKTVWISSEFGILNYDPGTRKSLSFQQASWMQFFPGSPFSVIGNEIVFGFSDGIAYFTPALKDNLAPSDPVIESVYVNNQPALPQNANGAASQKLVFSHADNSINIAFTAFLYNDPDHIKFRYRLIGADSKWLYTADQRSANYAQLPPGDYTFYVQCGNKNAIWNNNPASFSFVINPPYWATWWFRTLAILLIVFALYWLYRYRIKNILAIQKIRERIASDFHDDIGTALSSISIFSEVADTQLEEKLPHEQTREIISHISFQSRAMLDAMDDIIWAVNPQNDHLYDLAVRMREFAIPLLEARNIQFDIEIQEDILNTRIKMEARKNLFLIFKECINNILKHSGCTAMTVAVNRLNNQLELIITDNGKGFNLAALHTRNGLKNMQKRAVEINGNIKVTTAPGKGTVTRLLVNII